MKQGSDRGLLFVVSAPSGAGKTTICREFLKIHPEIKYAISTTTRPTRKGEQDGIDYFFTTKDEFERMIKDDAFLEYAVVYNEYYGTSKQTVRNMLESGYDVLVDVDTQGAASIRNVFPDSIQVFILPPSLRILEQRLRKRGKDSPEVINLRLSEAKHEIQQSELYTYIIVNDEIERSVAIMQSILTASRAQASRNRAVVEMLLEE